MATYTGAKEVLSGSTDGGPISIGTGPGTTVHTAGSGSTNKDEVWVFFSNTSGAARTVTLTLGGTSYGTLNLYSNQGDVTFPRGILIQNSVALDAIANGSGVYATGFVNRYTAD